MRRMKDKMKVTENDGNLIVNSHSTPKALNTASTGSE